MNDSVYFRQAKFLLQILPHLWKEKDFALKGGTAINYFYRDLPRLSVDIDLTFLPVQERQVSLEKISVAFQRISERLRLVPSFKVLKTIKQKAIRLIVEKEGLTIKIEPNLVLRGYVYPPEVRNLVSKAQELFEEQMYCNCLSYADLYAGKICAALDRQHPRDLFDIHVLLENEGLTNEIGKAFIVYLISHPRPIIELLDPNFKDISQVYENEFRGLTIREISLDELIYTRYNLVKSIRKNLTSEEKQFILSVKRIEPQWDLLGIDHIKELPAVQWKLLNLQKMDRKKHQRAVVKLENYLEL